MTQSKTSLRQHFIQLRQMVVPERALDAAQAVKSHALTLLPQNPCIIAGYAAIRGELDVFPLLEAGRTLGHGIALPCIEEKHQPLHFRLWNGENLEPAQHGIFCPISTELVRPDILLVPLVAFDTARHRLGYGGGYYDRTLQKLKAQNPELKAYGIAYACQRVDALPTELHDIPLDRVITEQGIV